MGKVPWVHSVTAGATGAGIFQTTPKNGISLKWLRGLCPTVVIRHPLDLNLIY